MTDGLQDLVKISELLKEQALAQHRKNLEESRRVAQEIEQIDVLRTEAQKDENSLLARQTVGADALWQSWLMRRRADLLREAAIARAYEIESMRRAQAAFAKAEASQSLLDDHHKKKRKLGLKRDADRMDDLVVLRSGLAPDSFE